MIILVSAVEEGGQAVAAAVAEKDRFQIHPGLPSVSLTLLTVLHPQPIIPKAIELMNSRRRRRGSDSRNSSRSRAKASSTSYLLVPVLALALNLKSGVIEAIEHRPASR